MKVEYEETSQDLQTRINIHEQFGGRNIDSWMLELLSLTKGMKILDIGCGSGKQCLAFYDVLEGEVEITGGDVSEELLGKAREASQAKSADIRYLDLDFNERFPFEDNSMSPDQSCFAIYYVKAISST